jgi:hypothetical protein
MKATYDARKARACVRVGHGAVKALKKMEARSGESDHQGAGAIAVEAAHEALARERARWKPRSDSGAALDKVNSIEKGQGHGALGQFITGVKHRATILREECESSIKIKWSHANSRTSPILLIPAGILCQIQHMRYRKGYPLSK